VQNENSDLSINPEGLILESSGKILCVSDIEKNYDVLISKEKRSFLEKMFFKYAKFFCKLEDYQPYIENLIGYMDTMSNQIAIKMAKPTEYSIDHVFIQEVQFIEKPYLKAIEFLVSDHTFPKGIPAFFQYQRDDLFNEEKYEQVKIISTANSLETFDINFMALDPRRMIYDGIKKERGHRLSIIDIDLDAGDNFESKLVDKPVSNYNPILNV